MKNRTIRNKPYAKLKAKVFFQILMIFLISIVTVVLIRSIGRGHIGNGITSFIAKTFNMEWEQAVNYYFFIFRMHIDIIMIFAFIVFFIILCRFFLTWFTKYFDDIVKCVDQLAEESQNKITMCKELHFMEEKLNQVKDKLERRAEELQMAEQRKNDLVVYLAHDIKTPLTSVIGYLSLLDETPDMPVEQKAKYVHITLDKAYRLESLINEFFEITRYNLQNVPLKKQNIDLYYMLIQVADEAYPRLSASGKKVEIHAAEDITIYGDSEKLARVFNNVLKNAVVYSDEGSTIDISAEIRGSDTIIEFKNVGTIPQNKLELIFGKFYRLDSARSTATGGAGLGLAIARDILTLHGGTIDAKCDETHTIFTITLPNSP